MDKVQLLHSSKAAELHIQGASLACTPDHSFRAAWCWSHATYSAGLGHASICPDQCMYDTGNAPI